MTNKNLIIVVLAGLVIFAVGGGAGVLYQQQKTESQPLADDLTKKDSASNKLSSKAISAIVALGQVTNIESKNITLSSSGDNLTVKIRDDAQIYSYTAPAAEKKGTPSSLVPVRQTAKFEDIKKGDNLNVDFKFLPDGQAEASTVFIISSATQVK